ncbi:MAG: sugar-binding transcriptional regulator [Spirochaetaceae bacterium]|nr:MAG: sugar-binding transcriptional regulator [Spirochaetaceae bacterium]
MRRPDRTAQEALEVAKLYFYSGLTTEQIAREMKVSRPKVSRLLTFAKESGMVEITIHDTDQSMAPFAREIRDCFSLNSVQVVPVPEVLGEVLWLDRVAKHAASYLNAILQPGMTVGLAWGTTLSAVSEHLIPKQVGKLSFVQLNGSGNTWTNDNSYAARILQSFADNYQARIYLFPVPTFFDYRETKDAMWRERSIQRVVEMQSNADVLLYSIGSVSAGVPSHVYSGGYLEPKDLKELKTQGVVGDLATVFYREDGSYCDISINARASGPPLDLYPRALHSICVVSGLAKVPGLIAALRAGYIRDLIVDEPTARDLMDRISEPNPTLPGGTDGSTVRSRV